MSNDQPSSPSSNSMCPGCQGEGSLLLPCGHSLCQACLELCQQELGQDQAGCTECYGRELLDSVLKGLLDTLFEGQQRRVGNAMEGTETAEDGDLCRQHRERLTQYCMEDEELICDQCQGEEHEDHKCSSIEEATQECKRELRAALRPLQEKLETLNTAKQTCQETSEHIRRQAQDTVRLIKENFEMLHQFLHDEEISMLRAVSEEEEQKSQNMKEKMDRLTDEIMTLREAVSSTEEAMSADDMVFLKNYKKASERMNCTVQDPGDISGALIDVAKHIGSLKFRVWEKMQTAVTYKLQEVIRSVFTHSLGTDLSVTKLEEFISLYTLFRERNYKKSSEVMVFTHSLGAAPVILDPNTADVCVTLSDDLTTIRYSEEDQQVPDNPERFCFYECVLGSEGFSSGRHSWDVEVGDCSEWALGVVKESVQRKEWFPPSPDRGMWIICLYGGEYRVRTTTNAPLTLKKKPQKIRVQLDWEGGRVMFSDAGDNSLLYKFKHKFTEKMFPYFSNTCKRQPLHILAEKVSVYTE